MSFAGTSSAIGPDEFITKAAGQSRGVAGRSQRRRDQVGSRTHERWSASVFVGLAPRRRARGRRERITETGRTALTGAFGAARPRSGVSELYGPSAARRTHFIRWRKLGVHGRIFDAVTAAGDGDASRAR